MKVFLTGTSGLLGSNTTIELLKRRYQVKGLFRKESELVLLPPHKNFSPFLGDITDAARMEEGIQGCDAVIRAADDTSHWPARSPAYVYTNVEGTRYVMQAAIKAGVSLGIFASTAPSALAFGMLGTISANIFKVTPKVSYKMARVSCDGHYFSAQKAVKELNMPQTPIETAIKECYEWFKANGYLNKK